MSRPIPAWAGLVAVTMVDASAGLLAAILAGLTDAGLRYPGMLFLNCIALGSLSHGLAPGWVLLPGTMPLHALKLRILAASSALTTLLVAMFVLLMAMVAVVFVTPVISLVLLFAIPVIMAGLTGLGAAWAHAVDPRTRKAALPIVRVEVAAIAGSVGIWVLPAAAWGLGLGPSPWQAGLLLGPCAVAAAALPLNIIVIRSLVAAGFPLTPASTMMRRASACCAGLLALSALSVALLPLR